MALTQYNTNNIRATVDEWWDHENKETLEQYTNFLHLSGLPVELEKKLLSLISLSGSSNLSVEDKSYLRIIVRSKLKNIRKDPRFRLKK